MPAATPNSFRRYLPLPGDGGGGSRKAKIGVVELRIVASPASTVRSAQAISVNGMALFRQACTRKRPHVAASSAGSSPRHRSTASRIKPADQGAGGDEALIGGIVSTPILMKVGGAPHSVARDEEKGEFDGGLRRRGHDIRRSGDFLRRLHRGASRDVSITGRTVEERCPIFR